MGYMPVLSQRFRGGELHLQPLAELILVAPNVAHLRARVPWNQCHLLKRKNRKSRNFRIVALSMIPQIRAVARTREPSAGVRIWDAELRKRAQADGGTSQPCG